MVGGLGEVFAEAAGAVGPGDFGLEGLGAADGGDEGACLDFYMVRIRLVLMGGCGVFGGRLRMWTYCREDWIEFDGVCAVVGSAGGTYAFFSMSVSVLSLLVMKDLPVSPDDSMTDIPRIPIWAIWLQTR